MAAPDPTDAVRRLVEAVWNGLDEPAAAELVSPGCPGLDGTGPEAVLAWHRDRRRSFPDLRYTLEEVVADGDRVAVRWTATGHQRGDFGPVPATGRPVTYAGATFLRLDQQGRCVDVWSVNELFQLVTQLGARVLPPTR